MPEENNKKTEEKSEVEEGVIQIPKIQRDAENNLFPKRPDIRDIEGVVKQTSTAPTKIPRSYKEQTVLYESGGIYRIFKYIKDAWKMIYDNRREERAIQCVVFNFGDSVATGDGKFYFHIDSRLNGMNLVDVHAEHITAGAGTGSETTDIEIFNVTQNADILSTTLTIDEDETGSDTAASAAVIDTSEDDMTENDVIRIDVDAIPSTTAPKGLLVTLGFKLP